MKRLLTEPRTNWVDKLNQDGFDFFTSGGIPYWVENAYYTFTSEEIDKLEEVGNKLHQLCLYAVDKVVSDRLFPLLGIKKEVGDLITMSWNRRDQSIYGRFDLMWDGTGEPKLLEYNADTPTSLFEASIVQWNWREQKFPRSDQFNSLHEAITERWRVCLVGKRNTELLYVTTEPNYPEDMTTVQYIGQLARDAGYKGVKFIPIQDIGWNPTYKQFRDLDELPMRHVFKLYPWEWLLRDDYGPYVLETANDMRWWEPPWKMVLSNKGILPILWEMFPEHPNLLPAYRDPSSLTGGVVRKPMLGREGRNIEITAAMGGKVLESVDGPYNDSGYIYQEYVEAPVFDGYRPNLGVWIIGDAACGMGVREDTNLIISNQSRFVPHIFD